MTYSKKKKKKKKEGQHCRPQRGYEWLASCLLANKNSLENTNSPQGSGGTGVAQAATLTPVHHLLSIHKLMSSEVPPYLGAFNKPFNCKSQTNFSLINNIQNKVALYKSHGNIALAN